VTTKNCRVCRNDFETDEPRRTVCDNCTDPRVRERNREYQRKRAKLIKRWVPMADALDAWEDELIALAGELQNIGYVSTGTLAGTLRKLNKTQSREGSRSGLLRVAAISLALARRLR
jgi:lysophospholipase L1-like esterase